MTSKYCAIAVLFCVLQVSISQNTQSSRFKSLKCFTENATLTKIRYCYAKVTRNSSTVAFNLTLSAAFSKPIIFKTGLRYKYGMIYRQVVRVPDFELCGAMKNHENLPPFMKAIFDVLGESAAPFFKGCPYTGNIDFYLKLDDSKWPSIFPSGYYKMDATANHVNPDFVIIGGTAEFEIKSSILTSF